MNGKESKGNNNLAFKCPMCQNGTLNLQKTVYDLPDEDKMLIITFECNNCEYHQNDLIPITTRTEPGISELRVTNEEDLKSKVYRSPTASLEIPELELEVEPGPTAGFYFTNIEGILSRFKNAVLTYKHALEDDDLTRGEIKALIKNIDKAAEGKFDFTLRIIDTAGGSYIVPRDKSKFSYKKIDTQ